MDRGQNELQPYTSFSNTILLFKHYILSHLHEQQILNKLCYNENGENTHFTYENIDSLHKNATTCALCFYICYYIDLLLPYFNL